jgi:hypothetical protein
VLHTIQRQWRRWVLATVAGISIASSGQAQSPAPIFTKNAALRLPVQLDERSRAEVAEVKLYVRGPVGRWECVHTAPPTQAAFDFKAPSDGEFHFTFVTVDRRGKPHPANLDVVPPHRVVIIDSTPPDVAAKPIALKGETLLQCQVVDANPDWSTIRAVYQSREGSWEPLMPAGTDTPNLFRVPSPSVLQSKIRIAVGDRAGNRTTREIMLGDAAPGEASPARTAMDRGRPDPTLMPKDADPGLPPKIPDRDIRGAGFPDVPKAPADMPALPDVPPVKPPDVAPEIKLPDSPNIMPPRLPEGPDLKIPEPPRIKAPSEPIKNPYTSDAPLPDVPNIKPPVDVPPPPSVPPVRPTSALKPSDIAPPDLPPLDMPKTDKKPSQHGDPSHRVINTRNCAIDYVLEGGAKLTNRVDFWASSNGGKTWIKLQDASGGVSPAKLTLPEDGVYGIRIRPGGGTKPPEPGEEPDCVVEVDTTKPVVNLLPPNIGTEDGTMILNWTAADTNLLSNAISIFYASQPTGPWKEIVTGYKNEGVYRWALPTGLSGAVYLKVEAADRAGNIGKAELAEPVALEAGKQRVKVIGVGPGK